uniref:Keratin n=1 Tax=Podarcis muralis TaxID=64176 RepID=A0A670KAH3_PODMU
MNEEGGCFTHPQNCNLSFQTQLHPSKMSCGFVSSCQPSCIPSCAPSCVSYPVGGVGSLCSPCGGGISGGLASYGGGVSSSSLGLTSGGNVGCIGQLPPCEVVIQPSPCNVIIQGLVLG